MADTVRQTIKVDVDGDGKVRAYTDKLKKNEKQTRKNQVANKGLTGSFKSLNGVVGIAGATIAIAKLTRFLSGSVEATYKQIEADTRLTTIMRTVTGATDQQIQSTMNMADAYQQLTTVGDEAIQMGQSQIASFGFNAEATQKLTGSLLDLSVATYGVDVSGEQLIQTANMLGKAYTGLPGMLSRAGVLLSDQQSEMIKTGTEAERLATLIEVVEQNYGGLAEAMAQTPEGKVIQLKNEFGDLREELGEELLPSIMLVTDQLTMLMEDLGDETDLESFGDFVFNLTKSFGVLGYTAQASLEGLKGLVGGVVLAFATANENVLEFVSNALTVHRELLTLVNNNPLGDKIVSDDYLSQVEEVGRTIDWLGEDVIANAKRTAMDWVSESGEGVDELKEKILDLVTAQQQQVSMGIPDGSGPTGGTTATPSGPSGLSPALSSAVSDGEDLVQVLDDINASLDDLDPKAIARLRMSPDDLKLNEFLEGQKSLKEGTQTFFEEYGTVVQEGISGVSALYDGFSQARIKQIDAEKKAQIDAVKSSTMSRRMQQKEIEKIEKKAEKQRKKALMAEWYASIATATANTFLAGTDVLARQKSGAIGKLAAYATITSAGLGAVGSIVGSKPRFFYGSRNSSGEYTSVGGNSTGDTRNVLARSDEVIAPATKKNLDALNGKSGGSMVAFNPQFNFNGGDLPSARRFIEDVREPLREMIAFEYEQRLYTNMINQAYL